MRSPNSERIIFSLGVVCMLSLFGMGFYLLASAAACVRNDDRAGAIVNVLGMLPFACGGSLMFVRLFLRSIAEGMVDSLLAPRRFRDRPAPIITPIKGLIKVERYSEAYERLKELLEGAPEVVEIRIMLFDLLAGPLDHPEEAMRVTEHYFTRPERIHDPGNAQLLLRYAGLARELGRTEEAILLFVAELRRWKTGYSRAERQLLENMLATLRRE